MSSDKTRLLVVDDEEINVEIILSNLEDEGYVIDTARDGVEAWEKLEREPEAYHAILLDRMMPRMDGMAVLARMKRDSQLRHIPVILQTAMTGKEEVVQGIRAGAYYYLTKPFEAAMLVSVVRTAVRDYGYYLTVRDELRETARTLNLMRHGRFAFRTLDEARALATLLANACPRSDVVVLGLSELMINAVEHGNLGITYAEKTALNDAGTWEIEVARRLSSPDLGGRCVEVQFEREGEEIRITITDQGDGFEWESYLTLAPERILDNHGRGIAMASMVSFSRLEYQGRGNQVVAVIEPPPAQPNGEPDPGAEPGQSGARSST
jgi:CheY-like chemotaxis protein